MAELEKEYAGDGVYLATCPGGLVVTTEDGVAVENVIYLEELVWQRLIIYGIRYGFRLPQELQGP